MKQVTAESIDKALEKIDGMSDEALEKLIETFTLEQEALVNHILQAGLEFESEELNVFSIYYFAAIYESFKQQDIQVRQIEESDIDEFQEPYLLALDAIHKDEDYGPMQDLVLQHHLMTFVMEELEAVDEDGAQFDEDMKTQLFLVLTGLVGLLNKAAN